MGSNSVINPVGHNFLGGGIPGRIAGDVATGGLAEFTKTNPFGLPVHNPIAGVFGNAPSAGSPGVSGPFSIDPTADQQAITSLGQKQYGDTLAGIDKNSAAQQQYASDTLNRMIPGIAENASAGGVLNSSAFPQEIARQASYLSQDVASQRANQIQGALGGLQGMQSGALQRGLSLEDFTNQANIAKSIGAQMAPAPPSGKAQFGQVAQGVGALTPAIKAIAK